MSIRESFDYLRSRPVDPARAGAEARRDAGMARAGEHADRVAPGWNEEALRFLLRYANNRRGTPFLAEAVRDAWEKGGGEPPPDGRAWGAVVRRAAGRGAIVKVGYAPANSSNRSPKCLWAARLPEGFLND